MEDPKIQEAKETMDILHEISTILNTGLDRDTLSLCLSLCENGVNPEALAAVIKELRRESAKN
ncbi:21345_t:CDS:2 [Gigaspora margarita]|uniref:Mitotic-spindle organizing protein 1 n=2 Tax=Gigaspora TaxID=4873 RepID=A0A397UZH9_9GLOM|nr:mitotic-spindle organizing gamma-tubulin ring associated-domain-containing protein [Gigaspora rosea]CAG8630428.1 21345_t:CDS:2 [Gigaspora margarita]